MKFRVCDTCEYKDIRRPGTACPMCDDGTMVRGEFEDA